jgi:hypothetical protein
MKMHLMNILNSFDATKKEKNMAVEHFVVNKVSHSSVEQFLNKLRGIEK